MLTIGCDGVICVVENECLKIGKKKIATLI